MSDSNLTILLWALGLFIAGSGALLWVIWSELGKVRHRVHTLSDFVHVLRANFDDWINTHRSR